MEALKWPAHFPPTGKWERFFIGVRWLGPDLSFFKALRQLQSRRDANSMTAWPDGEQRDTAIAIGRALQMVGWSTPYFLPDDSFNTAAYGPRFQSIDGAGWEILAAVEDEIGRQVPPGFWLQCSLRDMSFGEVIAGLMLLPRGTRERRRRWRLWQ